MKSAFIAIMILLNMPFSAMADIELPVENGVITSGVGLRVDPFGSGKLVHHRGIDIAVPVGTAVRAVRSGHVVFAGTRGGYGSTVIVEHANGDRTLYGHNSILRVQSGDPVESGTVVAFSGNTGKSTGPHVHFELLPSGRPVVTEMDEPSAQVVSSSNDERYLLEQKMDESVNSILRTINRVASTELGG